MKREEFNHATELLEKIDMRKELIDDINYNGIIEIGISIPGGVTQRINRFIDEAAYRLICDTVKNSVKKDLADMEREFAEL